MPTCQFLLNTTISKPHRTLPRIDLVCGHEGRLTVVVGTATPGADLENLHGAPQLPAEAQLLGYALIPPTIQGA